MEMGGTGMTRVPVQLSKAETTWRRIITHAHRASEARRTTATSGHSRTSRYWWIGHH